jgi:hypothetical protein
LYDELSEQENVMDYENKRRSILKKKENVTVGYKAIEILMEITKKVIKI